MLRVRGKKKDIDRFLELVQEEANRKNSDLPVFKDVSSEADKTKGYLDIHCDDDFPMDFVQSISNELPELKIQGHRYDAAWNGNTLFISKPGSGYLDIVEIGLLDTSWRVLSTESWWDKDELFYTEEKEDGTLIINGYYRWDEQLIIPEEIDGKKVTELADGLFAMTPPLTDLYIGNNIETIGPMTFTSCRKLLIHTDNKKVIDDFRNKRVMIVTSNDTGETAVIKRNFIYKASGKGITIYTYRGNSDEVTVPEEIEGFPVKKIAQKAFFGRKMKQVVFPSSITEFVPEVFEKGEVEYLVAPGIDFSKIKSIIWKQSLARGFLLSHRQGIYTCEKIKDAYIKYLKSSINQHVEPCVDDIRLLQGLLNAVKLTPSNYDALLQCAIEKNNTEARAMLLDYKNANISDADIEKTENRKLLAAGKAPSLSKIKKDWGYKVQPDNTIIILSYKGSDTDVIIPETIEEKPVVEIGEEAFGGVCYYSESKVIKNMKVRRQQVETIYVPSSVKIISDSAFIGCGDKSLGEKVMTYVYPAKKAKRAYPTKMMLIAEKKSFAEKFAKKEGIAYQVNE